MQNKKIRVMIVDDSLLFRQILASELSMDPEIEIVAKASDPFQARDMILETQPQVMTCDIEMPRMNGIEFIRRLLPQYPLPVIMVSTVTSAVFDAMNAGAVDFVVKPNARPVLVGQENKPDMRQNLELFIQELKAKIKTAAHARVRQETVGQAVEVNNHDVFDSGNLIAIGASTGGTEAIFSVLSALPANMPGIVIVQHIPPVFSHMFAERLDKQTRLTVKEAENNDIVEPGHVILAPGDKHIQVKRIGGQYKIECFAGEKVNGHCPSVDVLFHSVAHEAGRRAIGLILTGMGSDGARGLLAMRNSGARTLGQDEESCVVYGMPRAAYEMGAVGRQASLSDLPGMLITLSRDPVK
ncbi:MAG: chemotaxis response regulator protein-glutamate methylesterase [Clostridiaceae bacterium]|nr:chemotaxis response regulator protein-glutamate methylesterase [Clostridiaceae bacterium]